MVDLTAEMTFKVLHKFCRLCCDNENNNHRKCSNEITQCIAMPTYCIQKTQRVQQASKPDKFHEKEKQYAKKKEEKAKGNGIKKRRNSSTPSMMERGFYAQSLLLQQQQQQCSGSVM